MRPRLADLDAASARSLSLIRCILRAAGLLKTILQEKPAEVFGILCLTLVLASRSLTALTYVTGCLTEGHSISD